MEEPGASAGVADGPGRESGSHPGPIRFQSGSGGPEPAGGGPARHSAHAHTPVNSLCYNRNQHMTEK